jgi:4-hydroxybenzoate polyprenyltransferase
MIRFEHTIFALPFAYLGMVPPPPGRLARTSFRRCTSWDHAIAQRPHAGALNRYADALRACNPRTANRLLPTGRLSPRARWATARLPCWFDLRRLAAMS